MRQSATLGLFLVLAVFALMSASDALAQTPAGRVTSTTGDVHIERAGTTVPATIGMGLIVHDRVVTAANSRVTITLTDNSKLELDESTSMVIDQQLVTSSSRSTKLTSAPRSCAFRRAQSSLGPKDPQGTRCRPPEVSSIAFRTLPPEFTSDVLDGYGLRGNLPARPPPAASYPVLVHWLVRLLALPSDPVSRRQPLRFAILHLHQVGARTFTSPATEHARHTGFARYARRLTPPLTAAVAAAGRLLRSREGRLLR